MQGLERDLKTPKRKSNLNATDGLIVTGTVDDPLSVPSSIAHTSETCSQTTLKRRVDPSQIQTPQKSAAPVDNYYKHKILLRLRNKRFENNYDLAMYLLVRFGGPETSGGSIIINDSQLLACSAISKFKNDSDFKQWYKQQHEQLLKNFKGNPNSMDANQLNRRLAKMIAPARWCNREKLLARVKEQTNWNPFSIFGSSLPYVNIADIFNRSNTSDYMDKALEVKIAAHAKGVPVLDYLQNRWASEASPSINWSRDPLVIDEVLWYLQATDRYIDKSKSVCLLQRCFCVTPNPLVGYNWNDPRCSIWRRYQGPRPSMGEVLSASLYKSRIGRFKRLQFDIVTSSSSIALSPRPCRRRTASSSRLPSSTNRKLRMQQKRLHAQRLMLQLHYYKKYFGHNRVNLSFSRSRLT